MEPKYKNIRFYHPSSSEECERLLSHYDKINIRNRYYNGNNSQYQKTQEHSASIENMVRGLWGSQEDRYLFYDVFYNGSYHTKMREIDLVNIKSQETIEIGEIKFTSRNQLSIQNGIKQLQYSHEILSNSYKKVECVLIIVNLLGQNITGNNHIFSNYRIINKRNGFLFKLFEISVEDLFDYVMKRNIPIINADEFQSVKEEALINMGNRIQNEIDKISQRIDKLIGEINNRNTMSVEETNIIPVINSIVQSSFYTKQYIRI
jgi:hypothetical protein